MEEHVNQTRNSTSDGLVFTDASIILRTLVLGLLILVTVVGNLFVIAAILLERNLQSVANYLIVSLAVADLMVACLVMPLGAVYEINSEWSLGPELCDMWTSSDVLCCTASILHLVAIAVDRYWAVTDLNYIQARNPRRIGMLIVAVWVVSLGISLAPQLGWKDPDYLDRIADGTCLVSQDPAYQIFATCATFYLPLLVILFLYWRIFQAARKRIRRRPGTIVQPARERRGILRYVTKRPREESTAFTITRSTPDHSSISPEKSSSYNGANATQSTTVTPSTVSTTTTTTTTTTVTNPSSSHSTHSSSKRTRDTIESKREKKAAKTLAIITGAFVACWLPFFVVALLRATCQVCEPPELIASVFLWLGYFNSTLNPVIYTVFSPEFRQAFKRMLCGGSRIIR
ncbi:5-hydroxytryptamine receptor-like isoform X1 [Apis laboriosa]|nr:5-hydroxytryptamine receptor-like isoform X1 [Apis laboriosa]XP_043794994.1 5-hydroxytryptamine receptor-like isoform X1 [Apis laboriosa]XP_043794995.1 5-hydroxytryptamine receptor-like isoform X1 [Apis laboriosa]XP_043794996.1 5-hydroxytryptamine receptor-like isoform X1 [Apis laboriosa]XP_061939717.1 5-hydroxytryptamine receptor isoform X1 [Apis cerana]XP_061939718.1 5-hydroxytryptamine receptor isoform X1 [Apis cerana]XP_061939719.1 5-hydroxytryptamine receptor isoform X1 [Apis cerana]